MIEHLLQAERALANGFLDQAEQLYRTAAATDPRNAIAVVGLARVAVERGDESRALELGLRALEIDPENSAALRLVARIREVRAYRGEAVAGWSPAEALDATPKAAEPPTEVTSADDASAATPHAGEVSASPEMPARSAPPSAERERPRRSLLGRLLRRSDR